MKRLLINLIVLVIVDSATTKNLFFSQLQVGEYQINFLGVLGCSSVRSNNKFQFNLYLSKKSANTTEIKGNITHLAPFDDSLDLEFNLAVKDSICGWKKIAHIYRSPKACSSIKMVIEDGWTPIMGGLGINNATFPLHVGIFKASGVDTGLFYNANFPK